MRTGAAGGAEINDRDDRGRTALMIASWNNTNPDVIALLLRVRARIDDRNNHGMTVRLRDAQVTRPGYFLAGRLSGRVSFLRVEMILSLFSERNASGFSLLREKVGPEKVIACDLLPQNTVRTQTV